MSTTIDARGLACPQPVIAVKKALEQLEQGNITIIVDNAAAKENVSKFAASAHCSVICMEKGEHYYLTITKGAGDSTADVPTEKPGMADEVYVITSQFLGQGSEELGGVLIKAFFHSLTEKTPKPKLIMFMNSGIKLTTAGSPVQDHLNALAACGVQIRSCGTCLDYYGLKDALAVGEVTNMYSIVEELSAAGKAITL